MLVLINAAKAITRSKGRNLLIGMIVAVVSGASTIGLAISHAATTAETTGRDQLTITATLGVDRMALMTEASGGQGQGQPVSMDRMQELMEKYPDLSLEQLLGYARSDLVQDFRYSSTMSMDTSGDVHAVSTESDTENQNPGPPPGGGGMVYQGGSRQGGGPMVFAGRSLGDLSLVGYGAESAMAEFISGARVITSGAMVDLTVADNTCLISDEFATFNGLELGDTIELANPSAPEEIYVFTIVGIYHVADTGASNDAMIFASFQDPANQIVVSYPTIEALLAQSEEQATDTTDMMGNLMSTAMNAILNSSFAFSSPEDFEAFKAELKATGLDDIYVVTSMDLEAYDASLVPLKNLASFAQTLLWVVLAVGGIILVTISVFATRERTYEVGVLTAIGVPKAKVAAQFMAETFAVTALGLVVGLGIGAIGAVPVADNLLSAQIAQVQDQASSVDQNFGRGPVVVSGSVGPGGQVTRVGGPAVVDYLSEINATIDWVVAGQLGAIGLGLAILACAAGVIFVMRYEPLTILANRS